MKQFIFSLYLLLTVSFTYGQSNIEFIQVEVEKVEVVLVKKSEDLRLNNVQKERLHVVFNNKYIRINEVISRKLSKLETSKEITLIENEFEPKIAELLTIQQRIVFQKKKTNYSSDTK